MEKNHFDDLCGLINSEKSIQKFKFSRINQYESTFSDENRIYKIKYDEPKNLLILSLKNSESDEEKIISSWLADKSHCSAKDIKLVASDFIKTMSNDENKNKKKLSIKNNVESDNGQTTELFFANRMANMFPQIKEKIQNEKLNEENFRIAYITKNYVLPCVEDFLKNEKENSKIQKFGKLLSDLYHGGNLSVKSVITMGILININDKQSYEKLRNCVSDELSKIWDKSLKYKGKSVKPEKVKIRKSFMSRVLEAQGNVK